MFFSAQVEPKMLVSSFKFQIAAIRIEYTLSNNHFKQIGINFSVKNYSPSYFASDGYYSTTESLIRQFLSSDKSCKAGTIECCKISRSITLFRNSSLLNKLRRTSDDSSLSSSKKIGKIYSVVDSFPMIGQIDKRFSARACLTYVN